VVKMVVRSIAKLSEEAWESRINRSSRGVHLTKRAQDELDEAAKRLGQVGPPEACELQPPSGLPL
jgi:hypothetical protein